MIENEVQYHLTRSKIARFEATLAQVEADPTRANASLLQIAERNTLSSQLESLREEVVEYEALRSGRRRDFSAESFDELPALLIQAHIASGLTQKQLAQRLGLKEQQVQRYEATG